MKKIVCWLCLFVFVAVSVYAFTSSVGTGKLTTNTIVSAKPCYITAVRVRDDGTNALTVNVYDSAEETTSVSRLIDYFYIPAGTDWGSGKVWSLPRKCDRGIYITISGGTGFAIVEFTEN